MGQKELFLKEVVEKVGDHVDGQPTDEKVEKLAKHGTLFLFFEIMSLRKEIELLKQELNVLR